MSEKKVRGSMLMVYVGFVRKKWGTDGVVEMSKAVGIKPDAFMEKEWYPISMAVGMLGWMQRKAGSPEILEEAGAEVLSRIGAISYLVKLMDVKTVIKRSLEQGYKSSYNYGEVKLRFEGDRCALFEVRGFCEAEPLCGALIGSWKEMFKMKGIHAQVTKAQCQRKGAEHCLFRLEWQPR